MAGRKPRIEEEQGADAEGFRVEDRRHWQLAEEAETEAEAAAPARPTIVDEYRSRAEAAEQRLHEYIEAFKQHQEEQEALRGRLARDVDRKVDLRFGDVLSDLLATLDDLDLCLSHAADVPEAEPLAVGVAIARDRFLAALERHGVQPVAPDGEPFDPHDAEAVRVDPVDEPERDGKVTEVLSTGYRLGDRVIRAARVAVGRHPTR
jgi:molecular chaperone GrpE